MCCHAKLNSAAAAAFGTLKTINMAVWLLVHADLTLSQVFKRVNSIFGFQNVNGRVSIVLKGVVF